MGLLDTGDNFNATASGLVAFGVFAALHYIIYKLWVGKSDNRKGITGLDKVLVGVCTFGTLAFVGPPLLGYTHSMGAGVGWVDLLMNNLFLHPDKVDWLQEHGDAKRFNPYTIAWHMYFNIPALLAGAYNLQSGPRTKHPFAHRILGSIYVVGMTIGCVAAMAFCKDSCYGAKIDGAQASTIAFGFMAAAVLIPAWAGVYQILVKGDFLSHREWMLRSFASALGGGFLFRNMLGFFELGQDQYATWLLITFTSWIIPLWMIEFYNQSTRSHRLEKLWKAMGKKEVSSLHLLLSDHQDERIALLNMKEA